MKALARRTLFRAAQQARWPAVPSLTVRPVTFLPTCSRLSWPFRPPRTARLTRSSH